MGAPPLVLLVEDATDLAAAVRAWLERDGFRVITAGQGRDGAAALVRERADLVLLDLGLPDVNGLDLLRSLRAGHTTPVIIVTGRGDEADRVLGLELGADDYVVKPFSPYELSARIRAVLRRTGRWAAAPPVSVGSLEVDTEARRISSGGRPLPLAPLEYRLLECLAGSAGRAFSREQLLVRVWDSSETWQGPGTVDEHVYRVRRKLAAAGVRSPRITTVRGYGYRLDV